MVSKWVELQTVYHRDMKHHMFQFGLLRLNAKRNRAWNGVWVAVIWNIWYQRNGVVIKERKVDAKEMFNLAQLYAWS